MKNLPGYREQGPQGAAQVTSKNGKYSVTLLDARGKETNDKYVFEQKDLPEGAKPPDGKYSVSISANGDYLQGIRPWSGAHTAKFKEFTHKKDSPPTPKHVDTPGRKKDGTPFPRDEWTFAAILTITDGPCVNLEILGSFVYNRKGNGLAEDEDGMLATRGDQDHVKKVASFMEATGVESKPIPWTEIADGSVLPDLQEAMIDADREFLVVVKDGWPETYSELPQTLKKAKAKPKAAPKSKAKK